MEKCFWVDFNGYVLVSAETEEEAIRKVYEKGIYDAGTQSPSITIEGVEERIDA